MKKITMLLLLSFITATITQAQTIGIIQDLTPVTLKEGPLFNGWPTVEFPVVIPGPGDIYVNRFYKFDNSGNLVDIGAYPATTNGSQVCYGSDCYFGYCVQCTVNDFPQVYRAITLNCPIGSVSPWMPDPYSDPALAVATNNCTASEAWSNPLTWDSYKVPNPSTGAFYLYRNVTLDVTYDATNKSIQSLNGSSLTINSGVTFTSFNTTSGRFINNGMLNGVGQYSGVVNNGVVSPGGNGIGQFQGAGAYTQNASGSLNMQLASTNSFDKLYFTSGANVLGGTLKVSLLNGFVPVVNNSFPVIEMSFATYTGTFSNLDLPPLPTGLTWQINYNSNNVTLQVVSTPLPSVSIADKSIIEGNSGTKQMNFKVTLSNASTSIVTVNYTTISGTAVAGTDYVAVSGIIKIKPGKTKKAIKILINGDTQAEPNEQFSVQLSNPVNATIADNLAVGTIRNDDAAAIAANSSTSDAAIKATITLIASPNPSKDQVTVSGLSAGKTNYIELTDLSGRSLLKQNVTGNTATISIAKYAAGIYLLRYYDGNKWQQIKVVKE